MNSFDELINNLEDLKEKAENLNGTTQVSFEELFPTYFMEDHTNFKSFEDFLKFAGINSNEEFKAFPESELDTHISNHTEFDSWKEMQQKAGQEYTIKKLGL